MTNKDIDQDHRIAFYQLVHDPDANALVGAMLVLDELGKPQEFRVTFPVKPTMIQRQLYGEALLPHIGIELCGRPLYETIKSHPQLLIISHENLLGLADVIAIPVVYLERTGESLVINMPSNVSQGAKQKINSDSGRFEPINVVYPAQYAESERSKVAHLVADFFAGIDLLEPFDRINIAINTLRNQDERFR